MYYEPMPLYPSLRPCCDRDACVKVPVFDGDRRLPPRPMPECRRVTIENPCHPGECAEVTLGVDECGNLIVCVHRFEHDAGACPPPGARPHRDPCRPLPPQRGCERGRLYGTWR